MCQIDECANFAVLFSKRKLVFPSLFHLLVQFYTVFYLQYFQNYFGDPWNTLDFIIVIGSVIDIMLGRLVVSAFFRSQYLFL